MDTESLKAFLAVTKHRSFSEAGEELHITQPAVSKRIAALEESLRHALFNRLGRDVTLTEAGENLLPLAEQILRDMRETERRIRELSGEISGTLKVATSHHIGLHHLPPVLHAFTSAHPHVNLQFEFLDSEQAHERIARGECELAVVTLAPKLVPPLRGEVIWADPLVFVGAPKHVLAQQAHITLHELGNYPAILPDLNTFTGRLVKERFDREGIKLQLNMTTNYLETIKMMVSVGLGWSVLPKSMVDNHISEIRVADIGLQRNLGVVTHGKRTLGNAAAAFFDVIRNSVL